MTQVQKPYEFIRFERLSLQDSLKVKAPVSGTRSYYQNYSNALSRNAEKLHQAYPSKTLTQLKQLLEECDNSPELVVEALDKQAYKNNLHRQHANSDKGSNANSTNSYFNNPATIIQQQLVSNNQFTNQLTQQSQSQQQINIEYLTSVVRTLQKQIQQRDQVILEQQREKTLLKNSVNKLANRVTEEHRKAAELQKKCQILSRENASLKYKNQMLMSSIYNSEECSQRGEDEDDEMRGPRRHGDFGNYDVY